MGIQDTACGLLSYIGLCTPTSPVPGRPLGPIDAAPHPDFHGPLVPGKNYAPIPRTPAEVVAEIHAAKEREASIAAAIREAEARAADPGLVGRAGAELSRVWEQIQAATSAAYDGAAGHVREGALSAGAALSEATAAAGSAVGAGAGSLLGGLASGASSAASSVGAGIAGAGVGLALLGAGALVVVLMVARR